MRARTTIIVTGLVTALLIIGLSSAATIKGIVYDYELKPVTGAMVHVNTTPQQTMVTQQGAYEFELAEGTYELRVTRVTQGLLREEASATITITSQGTYTYDLILFQELTELEEPVLEAFDDEEEIRTISPVFLLIILLAVIGGGVYAVVRMKKQIEREIREEDDLAEKLAKHIKQEKRTTQKELRKAFPYAEATISLALTSLEAQGRIKKVKRGRSNIIIHEKD